MAQRQCSADSNESMSKIPRGKILSLPFPARISRRPLPHARRSRGRFCAPPFASHRWQLPSPLLGAPPSCVKRGGGSRGSGTSFSVGQRLGADRDTAAMTILPSRSVSRPASRRLLPRSTNNPVFSLLFFPPLYNEHREVSHVINTASSVTAEVRLVRRRRFLSRLVSSANRKCTGSRATLGRYFRYRPPGRSGDSQTTRFTHSSCRGPRRRCRRCPRGCARRTRSRRGCRFP